MELTWIQYKNQSHIKTLTEGEQIRQYYFYLDGLSNQIHQQNKGPRIRIGGFLLQENLFDVEQENGNKILITEYA